MQLCLLRRGCALGASSLLVSRFQFLRPADFESLPRQTENRRARLLANPPSFTHNSRNIALGGFMFAVRSRNFQLSLMLATALSVSMWPAASRAYTDEQQQACSADAFRLCGPDIPDVDRITACMIRNKSQLTPGCRAFFRESESAATPVAAGRPLSISPASSQK